MLVVMVLFNVVHPAQVTDVYHQRIKEEERGHALSETRERYLRVESPDEGVSGEMEQGVRNKTGVFRG
jgi:hypothetical protein